MAEEDRLSKLPDDILVKILSRLSTIDSVRTCVLAKRWVHLWTHITSLHFDIDDYGLRLNVRDRSFQKFVSMVFSRLASPTLESFSLFTGDSNPIMEQCCPHLVNKRLRHLYLSCRSSFPSNIFSCQTLENLSLELSGYYLGFPNFVHLPNLQTLELYGCDFYPERDSDSDDISQNNIILSFPVLNKLKSIEVRWRRFQSVSFEVPLLKRLEIEHNIDYRHNSECLGNYNFSTNPYVRIDSHELLGIIPSDSEEKRMERGLRACIFLQHLLINKVKHLELSYTEAFFFAKESLADFPPFNILRHLKLRKVCGEILVVFLVKSPYLTSLTIQMEHVPTSLLSHSYEVVSLNDHAEKLLDYGIVPHCISHALKKFKIDNFYGDEQQLRLVKYIMENAQNLELLTLSPSDLFQQQRSSVSNKENIKETLLSYKRSLNLTVTLDFSALF